VYLTPLQLNLLLLGKPAKENNFILAPEKQNSVEVALSYISDILVTHIALSHSSALQNSCRGRKLDGVF